MTPERLTLDASNDVTGLFQDAVGQARCSPDARAYVAGVLLEHVKVIPTTGSIVLAYAEATATGSFAGHQRLADGVLWAAVVVPDSIRLYRDSVMSLARLSYATCYRLVGHTWKLYEELADELPRITSDVRAGWCKRCLR